MAESSSKTAVPTARSHDWLMWIALALAGIMLLADAYNWSHLDKWTARIGITLVYAAFALLISGGKTVGYLSSGIVAVSVVLTFLL